MRKLVKIYCKNYESSDLHRFKENKMISECVDRCRIQLHDMHNELKCGKLFEYEPQYKNKAYHLNNINRALKLSSNNFPELDDSDLVSNHLEVFIDNFKNLSCNASETLNSFAATVN